METARDILADTVETNYTKTLYELYGQGRSYTSTLATNELILLRALMRSSIRSFDLDELQEVKYYTYIKNW